MSSSTLDIITTAATAAAVFTAAWAVISANHEAKRARTHQRLDERHRDSVALLSAFEEIEALTTAKAAGYQPMDEHVAASAADRASEPRRLAVARFKALLRASPKNLPITRGAYFNHTGVPSYDDLGSDYEAIDKRLAAAPTLGIPETEDLVTMRIRAELVGVIKDLRSQLSA